jgi:hypothetical protein
MARKYSEISVIGVSPQSRSAHKLYLLRYLFGLLRKIAAQIEVPEIIGAP